MKPFTEVLFPIALPVAALVSAAGLLASRPTPPSPKSAGTMAAPAELLEIVRGKRKFAQEDIQLVTRIMRRAGVQDFVVRLNADSGEVSISTMPEETAHMDIKPGSCPNPLPIRGGGAAATFPTGILGNAFNVTDVDLGSIRLQRGNPVGFLTEEQVVPAHITLVDVGTPFVGGPCECAALGPDGKLDLNIQYNKQEVIDVLSLAGESDGSSVPLTAVGLTESSDAIFAATDCVRIQRR